VRTVHVGDVRVVFPTEEATDSPRAHLLIEAVRAQMPVRGFRNDLLNGQRLTIRLVTDRRLATDASSDPSNRLIILPAPDVFEWKPELLARVLRHELAHVAVGVFFNFPLLPVWFEEGFAEWAAGGLDCKGEARVRLDLVVRKQRRAAPPRIFGPTALKRSRLAYDYFGTFFQFMEERGAGALSNGTLLGAIKVRGISRGASQVFAVDLQELEKEWQNYVIGRYADIPKGYSCDRERRRGR
jgi:hypothetical protein